MLRILFLTLTLVLAQSTIADCPESSKFGRKCFTDKNAPSELVFRIFVRHVFTDSLDYLENFDDLPEDEFHAGWHFVEAGLTPEMSSADVVRYFAARYLDIEKEVEKVSKQTLCIDSKPRYEGAENFVIFNQLEEVSLNVYEKHLLLARSDLQASGLFDLDEALREFPGQFVDIFMDHEKALGGSAERLYEGAVGLCKSPWGHSFSSSETSSDSQVETKH